MPRSRALRADAITELFTKGLGPEEKLGRPSGQGPRVIEIDVDDLATSPYQPRSWIDPKGIEELASSIERHGLLHPIIVRRREDDGFDLVAGERRLQAFRHLGRRKIPALVTTGDPQEIALIENLQREELHPLDEAAAFALLMESHNYSHEMLAGSLGRARSSVSETLAINHLPGSLREEARARPVTRNILVQLARISDPIEQKAAWDAVKRGASVRQLKDQRRAATGRASYSPLDRTLASGQIFIRQLQKLPVEQLADHPRHRQILHDLRDELSRILAESD